MTDSHSTDSQLKEKDAFSVQADIRDPWRVYLDLLNPIRPALHQYCCGLTGNVWDGEDLLQDAMIKVFSLLGKIDARLDNPKAYLIRTSTNIWIDQCRRINRERTILQEAYQTETHIEPGPETSVDVREAAYKLMQSLNPQERAAIVMKDVLDLSLDETAAILKTTIGAVKSAISRGRGSLDETRPSAHFLPTKEIVEQFTKAMADTDMDLLKSICDTNLTTELVGGAEINSLEESKVFFAHAHFVYPEAGFGENPWWKVVEYKGAFMVLGFRTIDDKEGLNEVHRLEVSNDRITKIRCYCWCPDTLRAIGKEFGVDKVEHPLRTYRSPNPPR